MTLYSGYYTEFFGLGMGTLKDVCLHKNYKICDVIRVLNEIRIRVPSVRQTNTHAALTYWLYFHLQQKHRHTFKNECI